MQKRIDFENPIVKSLLSYNMKVEEKHLKHIIMPQVGDTITLGNIIYKIEYVRENPFRFSASPVGLLQDEEFEKAISSDGQAPLPNSPDQDKLS